MRQEHETLTPFHVDHIIAGRTEVGRATVHLLRMNDPDTVDKRCLLLQLGELD